MIDRETTTLHRVFADRLARVEKRLCSEQIHLWPYETWRSPLRQAQLHELGRTKVGPNPTPERPMGGIVTWSEPWHSLHQYGLAVDLVFRWPPGQWSWVEPHPGQYARMHVIAQEEGLTPLFGRDGKLIEQAHVQLAGVSVEDLLVGRYPAGGGDAWADQLERYIDEWERTGRGHGPPVPTVRPELEATS